MSEPADVAALTDEQCDAIRAEAFPLLHLGNMNTQNMLTLTRGLIRAGRASLQANVPADVAALIAELETGHWRDCAVYMVDPTADCDCGHPLRMDAAAALQSQQERIAELERLTEPGQINWAERCGRAETRAETAEARVTELEQQLHRANKMVISAQDTVRKLTMTKGEQG